MNCPVCDNVRMREVQKDHVLIDVCPNCKGVWLDRGELEKILQGVQEIRQPFNKWYESQDDHYYPDDYPQNRPREYPDHNYSKGHYKRKRKKSVLDMLGDIFD